MKLVTTKNVEKLLQSLNNDPRLQALDDSTILSEEQYPVAFDALIMRIKERANNPYYYSRYPKLQ